MRTDSENATDIAPRESGFRRRVVNVEPCTSGFRKCLGCYANVAPRGWDSEDAARIPGFGTLVVDLVTMLRHVRQGSKDMS